MFKSFLFAAVAVAGVVSVAHADAFRPGASPAGGRIGAVCNTQLLSQPEQADCITKMKEAKNDAERREIRDTLKATLKERQKERDIENDRMNAGSDPSRARQ